MNDGFSFDSSITGSELFRVSWVNLVYVACDRRQNLKSKFAQVPEQSEFTCSAYLVAAWHLQPDVSVYIKTEARNPHAYNSLLVLLLLGGQGASVHRPFGAISDVADLHVEYAERGNEYGILFIFSQFLLIHSP